ncbi:hypothetical protein BD410DRAFT_629228 [Rickenella mellea]|uniref:Secreted protein n=1 Tax=Rickenella mellea TaxID=50990 RepID=A0A4Y7QCV9_9AGAM|nr:hypothetical protein BD410DRAFT_629228 [Rickenella mellea]
MCLLLGFQILVFIQSRRGDVVSMKIAHSLSFCKWNRSASNMVTGFPIAIRRSCGHSESITSSRWMGRSTGRSGMMKASMSDSRVTRKCVEMVTVVFLSDIRYFVHRCTPGARNQSQ